MRIVARFLRLPWPEKMLLGKSWFLLFLVRTAVWLCRFPWTMRRLDRWRTPVPRLVARRLPASRIARLLEIASHFVPAGRHCLSRAMVLETLLLRRGYQARTEIGVAKAAIEAPGRPRIAAHAWVTCEGEVLLGGAEAPDFEKLEPPMP